MATSARKLIAPEPPADLAQIELALTRTPRVWVRLAPREARSAIRWSQHGRYRFDSPDAKWGVCYLAESIPTAFQEIWGDQIRRARRLDFLDLAAMTVWQMEVASTLHTIELAGETLTAMKATLQCFVGSYAKSQRWGAALMEHPANLDGLQYLGRRSGRRCLALFGDAKKAKPHQSELVVRKLGRLIDWKGFWPFLDRIHVRVAHLPDKPSSESWG